MPAVAHMDFEFYETPHAFTHYLFRALGERGIGAYGNLFEPCVGNGAIVNASYTAGGLMLPREWATNDIDPRWQGNLCHDATDDALWLFVNKGHGVDWTISNPPFTPAIEIIDQAIAFSKVGVAMHLRASIHEVLKTGIRRTWMNLHKPTGILWLPRFAYQRSKTTGKWTTDSVCACWVIWMRDPDVPQFIDYAPECVIDALDAETPAYRERMDALMANYKQGDPIG